MAIQIQLRRGSTEANNAFTGATGELTYDMGKNTLRVHDGNTQGGFEFSPTVSNGFNLFDCKWSDHIIDNINWKNANDYEWISFEDYKAAYTHLQEDVKALETNLYGFTLTDTSFVSTNYLCSTSALSLGSVLYLDTEIPFYTASVTSINENNITVAFYDGTVGNYTYVPNTSISRRVAIGEQEIITTGSTQTSIRYYKADDGHKIVPASEISIVDSIFNANGVAWYYIIDTAQQRFKLPRTQWGFVGNRDEVGNYIEAGLPDPDLSTDTTGAHTHSRGTMNIKGNVNGVSNRNFYSSPTADGAFSVDNYSNNNFAGGGGVGSNSALLHLDASKNWTGNTSSDGNHSHTVTSANAIYGRSDTVQSPSTEMYLYFYLQKITQGSGGGGNGDSIKNQNTAISATNPLYNWEGTLEEYIAQDVEHQHPEWICLINDDVEPTQDANVVHKDGEEIITGTKTFDVSPIVPTVLPTIENSEKAASTKFVLDVLEAIYPIGSIYLGTQSECPMAAFFGTWELVAADRSLQGSSNNYTAGTTIEAGLPNITGDFGQNEGEYHRIPIRNASGAFYASAGTYPSHDVDGGWYDGALNGIGFDASRSSTVYGNSDTVQPKAYVVNVWRRTA